MQSQKSWFSSHKGWVCTPNYAKVKQATLLLSAMCKLSHRVSFLRFLLPSPPTALWQFCQELSSRVKHPIILYLSPFASFTATLWLLTFTADSRDNFSLIFYIDTATQLRSRWCRQASAALFGFILAHKLQCFTQEYDVYLFLSAKS